jgi:hypothetical protein
MKDSTKVWFEHIDSDLSAVSYLLNNDLLTGVTAFHCQQGIEKSL